MPFRASGGVKRTRVFVTLVKPRAHHHTTLMCKHTGISRTHGVLSLRWVAIHVCILDKLKYSVDAILMQHVALARVCRT